MDKRITPKFNEYGLVPVIVQDNRTGEVLMLAYATPEALQRTVETREGWFWSRSRSELWRKGATSGNTLHVERVLVDCDGDTVVYQVAPTGPTCHTGARSCFFTELLPAEERPDEPCAEAFAGGPEIMAELYEIIRDRQRRRPSGSYTTYLFEQGVDKIGKKIGEEAAEVIIAAKNGDPAPLSAETADLWFHSLVMLVACGIDPQSVWVELARRRK